jgi:hypothetical protein
MKRSLRSHPASGNQGTSSRNTSGSDHLAFNRAANTNGRGYSQLDDLEDERSVRSSPPRTLPGNENSYRGGRDSEDGRNSADLELPLYNKMSTSIQLGGEARRRTGPGATGGEKAGATDFPQPPYGDSVVHGTESEKHSLYDTSYDDDTGKAWGSKGFGAGPGKGGRRGLPPVTTRHPTNWREWVVYHEEWVWTGVYTLLAMLTRYWKIGWADYVVWDEVCFRRSLFQLLFTSFPRHTLGNSVRITSTVTFTLTCIPHSARCSSVSRDSCPDTTAGLNSNQENTIRKPYHIPLCVSSWQRLVSGWCPLPGGLRESSDGADNRGIW